MDRVNFITTILLLRDHLHDTNQGSMYINARTALVLPYAPDYSLPKYIRSHNYDS